MVRPKDTQETSSSRPLQQRRDNIKWGLQAGKALAHRLVKRYREWESGNKVGSFFDYEVQ